MCKLTDCIAMMHRPNLLVEAAAHGASQYERRRDLRRMLRVAIPPTPRAALERLLPIEADLESRRKEGATSYSYLRHIDILTALLAEARQLKAT